MRGNVKLVILFSAIGDNTGSCSSLFSKLYIQYTSKIVVLNLNKRVHLNSMCRGGSRISGKGVRFICIKGGGGFALLILSFFFLKIP